MAAGVNTSQNRGQSPSLGFVSLGTLKLRKNLNVNLSYKMITSQSVSSEAQVKNFFILYKGYVPFSRYSSFSIFNHPMICQICDVMMSINTQDRMNFGYIF